MKPSLKLLFKSGAIMFSFPAFFALVAANEIHDPFEYLVLLSGAAIAVLLKSDIDEIATEIYNQTGETVTIAIAIFIFGGLVLQWLVMLFLPLLSRNAHTKNFSAVFGLQALFSFGNAITGLLIVTNKINI